MFRSVSTVKGHHVATFRLPVSKWRDAWRIFGYVCFLAWLAVTLYQVPAPYEILLYLVAYFGICHHPRIAVYEKGIELPKEAGIVFFTRDQLLSMKLDGDRFIVIGPDADWKGPYAGGIFRICESDLPKFREALSQLAAV